MCIQTFLFTFLSCLFFGIFWNWRSNRENSSLRRQVDMLNDKVRELSSEGYRKRAAGDFLVQILDGLGTVKAEQKKDEKFIDPAANE